MWLRQSTASQEVLLGAFLDSTDGNTAETGLTIANTDIKLWKEGATTEANKNSGGATHIASGRYYAVLDATDTNTLGKLEINVHATGALAVRREFMVVPAVVYDALILGTDTLTTDVTQWLGTAVATPTTAGVPEVDVTHVSGVAEDISTETKQDIIDTNVDAILVDTGTTIPATISTAQADLDTITGTNGVLIDDTEAATLVDAVWDEAIAGHLTAGTTGLSEALGGAAIIDTTITGTPTTTELVLTAGSTIDDFYNDQTIYILSGTGVGQARVVTDYVGATKTVTVDEPWITTPAAADRVCILVSHVHAISQIQAGLATEAKQDIIDTNVDAILVDTGTTIPATLAALNDVSVSDVLTTQMTESYAADGTAPTLAQAIMLIQQSIGDFSIAGTTITAKQLDGTTTAATYTMDDATTPTSRTRAT